MRAGEHRFVGLLTIGEVALSMHWMVSRHWRANGGVDARAYLAKGHLGGPARVEPLGTGPRRDGADSEVPHSCDRDAQHGGLLGRRRSGGWTARGCWSGAADEVDFRRRASAGNAAKPATPSKTSSCLRHKAHSTQHTTKRPTADPSKKLFCLAKPNYNTTKKCPM